MPKFRLTVSTALVLARLAPTWHSTASCSGPSALQMAWGGKALLVCGAGFLLHAACAGSDTPAATAAAASACPTAGNGSCVLLPTAPVSYRPICNVSASCAACELLNETCRWEPSTSAGSCHPRPGAPAPYGAICGNATSAVACKLMNETCQFGPATPAPAACNLKAGQPPVYKQACDTAKDEAACKVLNRTCAWAPPPPPAPGAYFIANGRFFATFFHQKLEAFGGMLAEQSGHSM